MKINNASDFCHREFERIAKRHPHAIAVEEYVGGLMTPANCRPKTYRELDEESNQLARVLQNQFKNAETPIYIGLHLPMGVEYITTLLAIWKAGYAMMPLTMDGSDTLKLPGEKLYEHADKAGLTAIITRGTDAQKQAEKTARGNNVNKLSNPSLIELCLGQGKLRWLDELQEQAKSQGKEAVTQQQTVDSLAYIVASSGSTGAPKLIPINHKGLMPFMALHHKYMSLLNADENDYAENNNKKECMAVLGDIHFDAHLAELLIALTCGARVRIIPANVRMEYDTFAKWYDGVTMGIFTPSVLQRLQEAGQVGTMKKSLRVVLSTGEALRNEIRDVWFNDVDLINGWGPSEGTIGSYLMKYRKGKLTAAEAVSSPSVVLCPFDETEWKSDYENGKEIDINDLTSSNTTSVVCEVYICGDGLSPRYIDPGDVSKLNERYVTLKLKNGETYHALKTGDLAKWERHANNALEFVFEGRIDRQFKLHGKMVNALEIQAVLEECNISGVEFYVDKERSSKDSPQPYYGTKLIAYVWHKKQTKTDDTIPESKKTETDDRTHESIDFQFLSTYLESRLGRYMVPAYWLYLKGTPNVDKTSLKLQHPQLEALCQSGKSVKIAYPGFKPYSEQSASSLFQSVLTEWKKILFRDDEEYTPYYDDNFFVLGGDSISFSRFCGNLRNIDALNNKSIRYIELIKNPTLGGICQRLQHLIDVHSSETKTRAYSDPSIESIVDAQVDQLYPPLYLIHTLFGDAEDDYKNLAKEFKKRKNQYSVYAVSSPVFKEKKTDQIILMGDLLDDDLEFIAEHYAQAIHEHYKNLHEEIRDKFGESAPYVFLIAGWSAGGVIAAKVGSKLEQLTGRSASVVMLDSAAPVFYQLITPEFYWLQFLKGIYDAEKHGLLTYHKEIFAKVPELMQLAQALADIKGKEVYNNWVSQMKNYPVTLQVYRFFHLLLEYTKHRITQDGVSDPILLQRLYAMRAVTLAMYTAEYHSYPKHIELWKAKSFTEYMEACNAFLLSANRTTQSAVASLYWLQQGRLPLSFNQDNHTNKDIEGDHFTLISQGPNLVSSISKFVQKQSADIKVGHALRAKYRVGHPNLKPLDQNAIEQLEALFSTKDNGVLPVA